MATENQIKFMQAIIDESKFYDFGGRHIWISEVVKTNHDKGVFSKALEAGLVWTNGETVGVTDQGMAAIEQHEIDQWEPVSQEEQERILTEECSKIHARKGA
jgi:hypothetical protein